MEYEEAVEALKLINTSRVHPFYNWEEMCEVRDIAIQAIEKQIPKEPINKEGGSNGSCGYCPNCNHVVDDYFDYKVCQECGQAIDWSDRNE